jgi:uncharacterized protein
MSTRIVSNFHMMAKPIGPVCNLNCTYCYYLSKKDLLAEQEQWRMSDAILEKYIRLYIAGQSVQQINFSWQGGEPTLLGIEFFEKIVKFQKLYCPPTRQIHNDLQTNGTLLDEDWCSFLRDNRFLVGLSVDGPEDLHNYYRVDKNGKPTLDRVVAGAKLMQAHGVEFNTLTVVNRQNAKRPLDVYRYLRDVLGSQYLQFIPCVEPKEFAAIAPQHWDKEKLPVLDAPNIHPGHPDSIVTDWSVDPDDYGQFICTIFDEWVHNDVGKVFVPMFDCALGLWMGMPSSACYYSDVCGKALAFEHDGSVYSCDHYVYPEYRLGNIKDKSLSQMVHSERQMKFGLDKTDALPQYCKECEVLFVCNGECPKNRLIKTPEGEFGLNYLCKGLRRFFNHINPWMKLMAAELNAGRTADNVMKIANKDKKVISISSGPKPRTRLNAKCPCGSGRKYKKCCYQNDMQAAK